MLNKLFEFNPELKLFIMKRKHITKISRRNFAVAYSFSQLLSNKFVTLKMFEAVLCLFLLIPPNVLCLTQEDTIIKDTTTHDKGCLNGVFIKTNGEFVIRNMVKINLIIPGTGNIVFAAGAKEESNLMRCLTLIAGIWSLYNTSNYVYSYLDKDENTPSRHRTQLFLLSYIVGNILNYKRLSSYNRKVQNGQNLLLTYGLMRDRVYVGCVYQF